MTSTVQDRNRGVRRFASSAILVVAAWLLAANVHGASKDKPGSGLGLSIIVELANLYGGELTLGTAPIGGLRAELLLPAA